MRHQLAAPGVEYQKLGGPARHNEKPVVGFIERHGEIGGVFSQAPPRDHRSLGAVEDDDLAGVRDINEYPRAGLFKLKRFGMRRQRNFPQWFSARRLDNPERAFAVADVNRTGRGVEANVIGVGGKVDRIEDLVRRPVEDHRGSVVPIGHEDFF